MVVKSPQKSQVVYKFGGTSIGSVAGFLRIRDIIYQNNPQFVVISALAEVTDLLETFCESSSPCVRDRTIQTIVDKHASVIAELCLEVSIHGWIEKLRTYRDRALTDAMKADILSVGEDLSAYLLQQFCHCEAFPVCCLEARNVIITDDHYCQATPLFQEMNSKWAERQLSPQVSYIMQGFVGSNLRGETTVLGRGGSDYSAGLLGELIAAQEVRLYTDVQGVYTTDPKRFPKATPLVSLTFEEMYQLAIGGAKVVYPPMLAPCKRAEIPIFVTSTFDHEERGTWISSAQVPL